MVTEKLQPKQDDMHRLTIRLPRSIFRVFASEAALRDLKLQDAAVLAFEQFIETQSKQREETTK